MKLNAITTIMSHCEINTSRLPTLEEEEPPDFENSTPVQVIQEETADTAEVKKKKSCTNMDHFMNENNIFFFSFWARTW